ncbi:MAG: hypothetical protein R3B55_01995 [Candidatus Paceibacterota bacterium]
MEFLNTEPEIVAAIAGPFIIVTMSWLMSTTGGMVEIEKVRQYLIAYPPLNKDLGFYENHTCNKKA